MLSRRAASWFALLWLAGILVPRVASAVELNSGDIVLFTYDGSCGVFRLDPATLAPEVISSCDGLSSGPHHVAVNRRGRLFLTDLSQGIVEVYPATGAKSVLATVESLGGAPLGIGRDSNGDLLVTVQATPPRVVGIDPNTKAVTVVTEGGLLISPTGVDVAADGAIVVADQNGRTNPITGAYSVGGLVRIDARTGAQTLIAADPLYNLPQDIACIGDSVWIVNRGGGALRSIGGAIVVTRTSDGVTGWSPFGSLNSQGIAGLANRSVVYSGCTGVEGNYCSYPFVAVYGSGAGLSSYMGTLAVVPELEIPVSTPLAPAMPNPFAGSTTLSFSLATAGPVDLAIYSIDGRRLVTLESGTLPAGPHKVTWGGTDARGRSVRPGVYYARMRSEAARFSRTLVLVR